MVGAGADFLDGGLDGGVFLSGDAFAAEERAEGGVTERAGEGLEAGAFLDGEALGESGRAEPAPFLGRGGLGGGAREDDGAEGIAAEGLGPGTLAPVDPWLDGWAAVDRVTWTAVERITAVPAVERRLGGGGGGR